MNDEWVNDKNRSMGPNRIKFQLESMIDLNNRLGEKYDSELLIFKGNNIEIIQSLCKSIEGKKLLLTDYCSNPESRSIESELRSLSDKNNEFNYKIFPAVNTILNVESTINRSKYKNPKSMQDMQKIFDDFFEKTPAGHLIDIPLADPQKIQSDKKQIKNLKNLSKASKFYIPLKLILESIPKTSKSYFIGGETEALKRLKNKISDRPNYVKNFRKPSTISTNLLWNLQPLVYHLT